MNWSLESVAQWLDRRLVELFDTQGGAHGATLVTPPARRPDPIVIGPSPIVLIGPDNGDDHPLGVPVVGRSDDIVIQPDPRPVWDDMGWEKRVVNGRTVYEGDYAVKAPHGAIWFPGRLEERGGSIDAYIADPPSSIKRHPKGPCFQLIDPPWFKVHWHRPARNPDDAILYVQRILYEVLN